MFHDPLVVRACILPKESMGDGMSCLYWLRVSGFSEGSAILQVRNMHGSPQLFGVRIQVLVWMLHLSSNNLRFFPL